MTQRIILFGGSDRCGKTEISQALARCLHVPVFKASTEHDTYLNQKDKFKLQLQYADTRMVDFLQQTGHSVIFDRSYVCEWCYSKVFNRETDEACLRHVDDEMAKMGARVIICRRSSYEGISDDIDPKLNGEILQQLDDAYVEFSKWTKCKTLLLNVDDENLERELNDIMEWLQS